MTRYLTIDLGTTLLKFAAFDECGQMQAMVREAPPIEHPQPNRWELSVDALRKTIIAGIAQVRALSSLEGVAAVSFASQANSFTLLDGSDRPLCPIILWPDERAADEASALNAAAARPGFSRQTGLPALGVQFSPAKLRWLARAHPSAVASSPRLFFISDLLTYWFTRKHVTEAGVAGLSGAVDIRALRWRDDALAELGFAGVTRPELARAGSDVGPIDAAFADEVGLPSGCRFVVGCLDQYAGAIGTASVTPGALTETTGTVLAAVRCVSTGDARARPGVFVGPSFDPGLLYEMSFSSTSANLLEHYRNTLPDRPPFATLVAEAERAEPSALTIEPLQDGQPIETCFRNVRPDHSRGQVVRAIMACVAARLAEKVRALCGDALPARIASAGGGARSRFWLALKRDALGVRFVTTDCLEPTSRGAAILAAAAVTGDAVPVCASRWVRDDA